MRMQSKNEQSRVRSVVYGLQSAVSSRAAFTLIELLVAMSLLMVIVLMLANLFQQSTRAWDAGLRQAEVGLEARAAINIIQKDLSRAVCATNVTFDPYYFDILNDSATNLPAIQSVVYDSDPVTRSVDGEPASTLVEGGTLVIEARWADGSSGGFGLPDYFDITLDMTTSKEFSEVRVYAEDREYDSGRPLGEVVDTRGP